MCQIIEFNGNLARIAVKGTWLDALKSDLPMIKAAFQEIFQRQIEVYLEKGTSATGNTTRTNPQAQNYTPVQQPPAPKYNQLVSDAPQPATPKPAPSKTESTTGVHKVQTLSPPQIPTHPADWGTEEVESAAQRLAQFFDGQIIRLTGDALDLPETMTISEWMDESELDDE
jgi:DNA polymerase-3 subunit gamma/tau